MLYQLHTFYTVAWWNESQSVARGDGDLFRGTTTTLSWLK